MLNPRAGSIVVTLVVTVALVLLLTGRFDAPDSETVRERLAARGIGDAELDAPVLLEGALRVNDSDDATLGSGAPVWIEAELYNVGTDLRVRVPSGLAPVVTHDIEGPAVAIRTIAGGGAEIAPGGRLHLAWWVEGAPAPGTYAVTLEPSPLLRTRDPVAARVEPARFVVTAAVALPERAQYYARRIAELRRRLARRAESPEQQ